MICCKCLCGKDALPVRFGQHGFSARASCPECKHEHVGRVETYADGRGRMLSTPAGDLPMYEARNRWER